MKKHTKNNYTVLFNIIVLLIFKIDPKYFQKSVRNFSKTSGHPVIKTCLELHMIIEIKFYHLIVFPMLKHLY